MESKKYKFFCSQYIYIHTIYIYFVWGWDGWLKKCKYNIPLNHSDCPKWDCKLWTRLPRNYFFRYGWHDISSSNAPIYLKFGRDFLNTIKIVPTYEFLEFCVFIIFKKFPKLKKGGKKMTFLSRRRHFVKKKFFQIGYVQIILQPCFIRIHLNLLF